MSVQYAVLHTEKGKGIGGGLGNHIDRTLGMEHTYPHADPKRLHLNIDFTPEKFKNLTIPEAVVKRIHEGYKGERKIRSDAVKYLSTVLTGSHEQMKAIEKDPKLLLDWVQENAEFVKSEFGAENIVRFTLHLDEKTPHIHCVHVPLTKDGRLSAKEVMGDKVILKNRQDLYALQMKPFGLERGQMRAGVYHETAQEYYRRINITESFIENLDVQGLFGIKTDETLKKTKNALKTALMSLEREKRTVSSLQKSEELKNKALDNLRENNSRMKETANKNYQLLKKVAEDPQELQKLQAYFSKLQEQEKEQKKGRGLSR